MRRAAAILFLISGACGDGGMAPSGGGPDGGGDLAACNNVCAACGVGELCATGLGGFQGHSAACLKTCTTTDDCPMGMRCASLFGEMTVQQAVCVSTTVPPRCGDRAFDPGWHCDFPAAQCFDATTLSMPFSQPENQVCGQERVHCPNGCQPAPVGDLGTVGAASCK
jgi:hypothetical protein